MPELPDPPSLCDPVYEDRWREWVNANRTASRETSARRLVEACGLPTVTVKAKLDLYLLPELLITLRGTADALELAELDPKVRHGVKRVRQPAYGRWVASTVIERRLRGDAAAAFTPEVHSSMAPPARWRASMPSRGR